MAPVRRHSAVYRPEYVYLARRVKEARLEAGLTQVAVAAALGRPISFVSKCELGERRMDPVDLRDFAQLYEKPYEYFLEDMPNPRIKRSARLAEPKRRKPRS